MKKGVALLGWVDLFVLKMSVVCFCSPVYPLFPLCFPRAGNTALLRGTNNLAWSYYLLLCPLSYVSSLESSGQCRVSSKYGHLERNESRNQKLL